jgi:hypothetical protein
MLGIQVKLLTTAYEIVSMNCIKLHDFVELFLEKVHIFQKIYVLGLAFYIKTIAAETMNMYQFFERRILVLQHWLWLKC